jgi:hypothetical protein
MFKPEMTVFHNGRMIPSKEYHKLRMLESLSPDAKVLLTWLTSRGMERFSTVEVYKNGPSSLRKVNTIRQLLQELNKLGFITPIKSKVVFEGAKRKECWELCSVP